MWAVLWLQPYSSKKDAQADLFLSIPKESESMDILLIHEGDENYSLISFRTKSGEIKIQSNLSSTPSSAYQRKIRISDRQIVSLVDLLKGINIELKSPLKYSENGIHVLLEPGVHTLSGEQLLHYMEQADSCDQLRIAILQQLLPKLCEENGQNHYISMLDCMNSDLTVSDYDNFIDDLSFLLNMTQNPIHTE